MHSMHRLLLVALKCQAMAENCKFCSVFCLYMVGKCGSDCDLVMILLNLLLNYQACSLLHRLVLGQYSMEIKHRFENSSSAFIYLINYCQLPFSKFHLQAFFSYQLDLQIKKDFQITCIYLKPLPSLHAGIQASLYSCITHLAFKCWSQKNKECSPRRDPHLLSLLVIQAITEGSSVPFPQPDQAIRHSGSLVTNAELFKTRSSYKLEEELRN